VCSVVHPCSNSPTSYPCCKAQTRASHWEIADQVPHQRDELDNGRNQGQDGGMEADGEVNGHDNGAKVGCGERQSRTAHEVNGILVRAHQECPRCEEQHGTDGPPIATRQPHRHLHAYGCINPRPRLPNRTTSESRTPRV